ncbi:ABC transporter permease subunit [Limibaculum sp. M0105]|uniref:ABC transporter permease subunit n=1 Tax=Thermohalobaculum xanthum TaxID=2753746 RepID=A0A8J7M9G7_9RHOB|nr:ABC transporter permease subunit [Thermohalobaculum xanthum]MBK0400705.1 ABC transporter permease subunit [Thermohalobaculum xanthum]
MNFEIILEAWPLFAKGVWITLHLTVLALSLGFVIALPAALSLHHKGRFHRVWGAYVYVFRGTPLLVQTYLIYYGLSQFDWVRSSFLWGAPGFLDGTWLGAVWPSLKSAWWCALIAFSLNSGAYQAEILRGGLAVVPEGELEGAKSLGLNPSQVTRLVLLPSALRRALPQYGNEIVFMLHGSVVASVITIQDILGAGRTLNARHYVAYEGFLTSAALYMAITFAVVWVFRLVERRYLRHLNIRTAKPKGAGAPGIAGIGGVAWR